MIEFEKFILDNGLKVIVHKDKTTPVVAVNILYNVGAKDENPDKTGFAHLFEHLMFGGSINIPKYDQPLQEAGGSNNAFTNNDFTNYYITIPKSNIETAFWLESDRMLSLAFTDKSLETQRSVVIEEFKQRYLNQPYGDMYLLMRPLAYKVHPYQWATIGKEISHIEKATMQDVKEFFYSHYAPNNAIMTVAGDVDTEYIKKLAGKWFGPIEKRNIKQRNLPKEPAQIEPRTLSVERDVPIDAFYKAYHMGNRYDYKYYPTDLLSDILSGGESSRLVQNLIKNKQVFSDISAYVSGSIDEGLFMFSGKLSPNVTFEEAENAINEEINNLISEKVTERELQKVKNKVESRLQFAETDLLTKAMNLSYFELLGDAKKYNNEINNYTSVTADDIQNIAKEIFQLNNSSTIYYKAKQ